MTITDYKRKIEEVPPTRQCLVCDALENPKANLINGFWLCPECKERIRKLLYKEK